MNNWILTSQFTHLKTVPFDEAACWSGQVRMVFAKRHLMDSSVEMRCLVRELCEVDGQPTRADAAVRIAGPYELPFLLHGDGANLALPSSSTE